MCLQSMELQAKESSLFRPDHARRWPPTREDIRLSTLPRESMAERILWSVYQDAEQGGTTDAIVRVGGISFPIHTHIAAVHSMFFERMTQKTWMQDGPLVCVLDAELGISANAFEVIRCFWYTTWLPDAEEVLKKDVPTLGIELARAHDFFLYSDPLKKYFFVY